MLDYWTQYSLLIEVRQQINRLADTYFSETWPAAAEEEPSKFKPFSETGCLVSNKRALKWHFQLLRLFFTGLFLIYNDDFHNKTFFNKNNKQLNSSGLIKHPQQVNKCKNVL